MAVEEAKKIDEQPECSPELPVVVVKEDEKAIVPVEPCVPDEKPTDDTKALVVIESNFSLISNLYSLY